MPLTDQQAGKFGDEIADLVDLALDKISNKDQVDQFLKEGLDVYGVVAGMDLTDAQVASLCFHLAAKFMERGKKYFPLNPPKPPVP